MSGACCSRWLSYVFDNIHSGNLNKQTIVRLSLVGIRYTGVHKYNACSHSNLSCSQVNSIGLYSTGNKWCLLARSRDFRPALFRHAIFGSDTWRFSAMLGMLHTSNPVSLLIIRPRHIYISVQVPHKCPLNCYSSAVFFQLTNCIWRKWWRQSPDSHNNCCSPKW